MSGPRNRHKPSRERPAVVSTRSASAWGPRQSPKGSGRRPSAVGGRPGWRRLHDQQHHHASQPLQPRLLGFPLLLPRRKRSPPARTNCTSAECPEAQRPTGRRRSASSALVIAERGPHPPLALKLVEVAEDGAAMPRATYGDGDSAWDAFPDEWRHTVGENANGLSPTSASRSAAIRQRGSSRRSPRRSCAAHSPANFA
jgi:hypothetical protein